MPSGQVSVLPTAMLTRWRRRRLCIVERAGAPPMPAVLRTIDGLGAYLECGLALAPGDTVTVRHPEAGCLSARIEGIAVGEARLAFAGDTASVAFALAVIASDMSSPA